MLMKSFLCPENGFKSKNNINLTYYSMNLQIAFILMGRLILHVPKSQLAFFIFQNYQLFHQHKDHTAIDMSDHIIRGKTTNITKVQIGIWSGTDNYCMSQFIKSMIDV